jgi:hypothetical protein
VKQEMMARAFNEWMRRFVENPEQFEHQWQAVSDFLAERSGGKEPTYGERAAAYLVAVAAELEG